MAKTKLERIATLDEQIAQLSNQKKQLQQKHKADERKARTRRLIQRGAILEGFIPEAETYTEEQIQAFLKETLNTDYARKALRRLNPTQGGETATTKPETAPQGKATLAPAKAEAAQQEAADPAPVGAGGGARNGG